MPTPSNTPTRKDQPSNPGKGPGRSGGAGDANTKSEPTRPNKAGENPGPGRTIEAPGEPGLEKEPNRDKAAGPGGQRLTSGGKSAGRDVEVPGVDRPDGINTIDPAGETKAEDDKLL